MQSITSLIRQNLNNNILEFTLDNYQLHDTIKVLEQHFPEYDVQFNIKGSIHRINSNWWNGIKDDIQSKIELKFKKV